MTDLTESVRPGAPASGRTRLAAGEAGPLRVTPPGVALAIVLAGQLMAVLDTTFRRFNAVS
jgi:hypothetical protein